MEQQPTVLIVDDESDVINLMRDFLEMESFRVETAQNGQQALSVLERVAVDCLLLDVMMPEQTGFDLCRQIRETRNVPILFLSARDGDVDKIRGLGLGGDDYIVKSATPSEVLARIKAVLRRYQRGEAAPPTVLDFGRLQLDVRAREIRIAGTPVAFTAREFDLLYLLATYPRQVFTSEQLFERFWGEYGDKHTVAVHIARIREKIEADSTQPQLIATVWGVGYRFEGKRI